MVDNSNPTKAVFNDAVFRTLDMTGISRMLASLKSEPRSLGFAASANTLMRGARQLVRALKLLPELATGDEQARQTAHSLLIGPATIAAERSNLTIPATLPGSCEHLQFEGLAGIAITGALLYNRDALAWAKFRTVISGLTATAVDLHWLLHLGDAWEELPDTDRDAFFNGLRGGITARLPARYAFEWLPECEWYKDPVIERIQQLADDIARVVGSVRCSDGTYSNAAITAVEPRIACAGEAIQLVGSFPATRDPNVRVLMLTPSGYLPASIRGWTSTAILVSPPPNVLPGCVWLEDASKRQEYFDCLFASLPPSDAVGKASAIAISLAIVTPQRFLAAWFKAHQQSPADLACQPESRAYFGGTSITIRNITVNGISRRPIGPADADRGRDLADVWIGQEVRIGFSAQAVEQLGACIESEDDLFHSYVPLSPDASSFTFITPAIAPETLIQVSISGSNHCSGQIPLLMPLDPADPCNAPFLGSATIPVETTTSVMLRARATPNLRIVGIEATQGVQHFDLSPGASSNNSINLIRKRTTALRVYVDSGLSGTGAAAQVAITGTLSSSFMSALQPIREGIARPVREIDRASGDALTFIVPGGYLDASWRLFEVIVNVVGQTGLGFIASQSIGLSFEPGGSLDIMGVLYDDANLGLVVTDQDLFNAIGEIARFLPIADDAIQLWIPASTSDYHQSTARDLTTDDGWDDLMDDLEDLADGYEDEGEHWMAIVPSSSRYSWGGIGIESGIVTHPHCVSQAVLGTPAHEILHTYGINHAPCRDSGARELKDIDSRLRDEIPNGRTEEIGYDVMSSYSRGGSWVMAAGRGDLMSYCVPQWISVALWLYVRDVIG
jgi:hypothetical protein